MRAATMRIERETARDPLSVVSHLSSGDGESANVDGGDENDGRPNVPGTKILRNANYVMRSTRFDDDVQSIQALSKQMGGWVINQKVFAETESDDFGRICNLQVRIPDSYLTRFLAQLEVIGSLQTSELIAEDYSQQYQLTLDQLAGLEGQMERLRETLAQTTALVDSLEIEMAITKLQAEIDAGRAKLQSLDAREVFAQVDVTLRESAYFIPSASSPLGERLRYQFARSIKAVSDYFKDMLVFMVIATPWVLVVALMAGLALAVERLLWRSRQM